MTFQTNTDAIFCVKKSKHLVAVICKKLIGYEIKAALSCLANNYWWNKSCMAMMLCKKSEITINSDQYTLLNEQKNKI